MKLKIYVETMLYFYSFKNSMILLTMSIMGYNISVLPSHAVIAIHSMKSITVGRKTPFDVGDFDSLFEECRNAGGMMRIKITKDSTLGFVQ